MAFRRFALATCSDLPRGDDDDALLAAALSARGHEVSWILWDDPEVDWGGFDLVVVRSTWDYQSRREEFLEWAERVPVLCNPAAVLRWNTDKRYLTELGESGIDVVETEFVDPGEPEPALLGSGEVVVKPSVSAGSRDTARFLLERRGERDAALELVREIHAGGRTVMVQPYLADVDANGETALIHLAGAFSHSIRKGPLLVPGAGPTRELFAAETIEAREATEAERVLGERVIAAVQRRFGALAYARVDVITGDAGPLVLELELTEPSLFFKHSEGAAEAFAEVLCARVAQPPYSL